MRRPDDRVDLEAAHVEPAATEADADALLVDGIDLPGLYAALDSAQTIMALSGDDWSRHANDAWLYGILIGWDGDPDEPDDPGAWQALAELHGWDADTLDRLRTLHAAVAGLTINAIGDMQRRSALLAEQLRTATRQPDELGRPQ